MTEDGGAIPTAALEDVAYLARSANRIEILELLAGEPHSRRELSETTGISRATLARIMTELEDRNWVERAAGNDYVATSTGSHVVAQFVPFLESMATIRNLGEAVEWLPTDELNNGLQHFSDATVVRPANDDPMDVIDRFNDLLRDAADFRTLTHFAPPDSFAELLYDGLTTGRLAATVVTTGGLVEYFQDRPERRNQWRDCLDAGACLYRYDGDIPCNLWVIDETVLIKKSGAEALGRSYGVPIVSQNDAVHEWACELIDTHRADATPVEVDTFTDDTVRREGDADEP